VKQLLVRVPDDLHARLLARAKRSGRSATAIATELLEAGVGDESGDARADLRARARRLGLLASAPAPAVDPAARRSALRALRGIGPVIDDILADGR
jgi:plasmid stability protein